MKNDPIAVSLSFTMTRADCVAFLIGAAFVAAALTVADILDRRLSPNSIRHKAIMLGGWVLALISLGVWNLVRGT